MKHWAEDNYLERLMPQLRQANRMRLESCPDSDLLTAFTEEQLTPFVRSAITAHLAQCKECSEICARLVSFNRATVPAHDPEWVNAEKRLDNWKDSFVQSRAAANRPVPSDPARVVSFNDVAKPGFFSLWQWALGAVAALVIVAGVIALNKDGFLPNSKQIADGHLSKMPSPETAIPPTDAVPAAQSNLPAANSSNTGQQAASQLNASAAKPPVVTPPSPQPKVPTPPQGFKPAFPPDSKKGDKPKKDEPKKDQDIKAENPDPDLKAQNQAIESQPFNPPALNPNDRILTGQQGAAVSSAPASGGPAGTATNTAPAPSASANPSVAPANLPASLRLEPGSRLWIQVSAINHQADGSFTFHGSLLQPAEASVDALKKGTEVAGSGSSKDGKVALQVSGFSIQGVPYTLPAMTAAAADASSPGSGKALQFNKGQVLEMWISAASTYERAAAGSSIEPRQ
jgi:hypothetical protein